MDCFKCPTGRVVDPPRVVFNDVFHPQIVEVIHPIEIVNRHHCVPVPVHCFTVNVRDEFCPVPVPKVGISSKKRKRRK